MSEPSEREPLLIVGASARAAAFSALAGGYEPHCLDLFADVDLARRCPVAAVSDYPQGFLAAARTVAPMPWLYSGGLENHPDLVDAIAGERTLLGNDGSVLRRARDPWLAAAALDSKRCRWPEARASGVDLPRDGSWLRKGFRSAGGLAVKAWDDSLAAHGDEPGYYFQQRIAGESCSAVFVATGTHAVLLGVTRQLVGCDWAGCDGFLYCGSIGPLRLARAIEAELEKLGQRCATRLRMVGLFGVDFLLAGERVRPVDLNPRFPASVETLERAHGWSAVGMHVAACRGRRAFALPRNETETHGKAIVFARADTIVSPSLTASLLSLAHARPHPLAADVPAAGTAVLKGQPVCTLFARGANAEETLARLQAAARDLAGA